MEKYKLKLCPFCGVKPFIKKEWVIIKHSWLCHLPVESFNVDILRIATWNRRPHID